MKNKPDLKSLFEGANRAAGQRAGIRMTRKGGLPHLVLIKSQRGEQDPVVIGQGGGGLDDKRREESSERIETRKENKKRIKSPKYGSTYFRDQVR